MPLPDDAGVIDPERLHVGCVAVKAGTVTSTPLTTTVRAVGLKPNPVFAGVTVYVPFATFVNTYPPALLAEAVATVCVPWLSVTVAPLPLTAGVIVPVTLHVACDATKFATTVSALLTTTV